MITPSQNFKADYTKYVSHATMMIHSPQTTDQIQSMLIVKTVFLPKHRVFWRLDPNAEDRPSPPHQKQRKQNGCS
jgi:hypothetical protein